MTKTALGTVYGVILNDPYSVQALGSLDDAPYKGAPKAPVLYIKPANTHASEGACVVLPTGTNAVEVAATVGLVVGRAACRLPEAQAMEAVSGLVLAADLSLPHDSYYRPAIREKIFDGALPMSGVLALTDLAGLCLETRINGETVDRHRVDEWIRSPARLLSEVSAFMTLNPGDVLLLGVRYRAPQALAGASVDVRAEGLGALHFTLEKGDTP
jgi:5-oxopent-3-ene-1,2,5-tricarboxylate decarboxylase / 2-hydroxyhepta-2,4-diene-1,7-dioate isomerase